MHSGRISGAALIAGALLGGATMAIHPSGADLGAAPDALRAAADTTRLAHALALTAAPLLLFGYADFSRRLGVERASAMAGLAFWVFATMGVLGAAMMSGPIAGSLLDAWADTTAGSPERPGLKALMDYTHYANRGFALVYGLASAAALAAWSAGVLAARRGRGLPLVGLLAAALQLLLFAFGGRDALSVHGFMLVALLQGVWAIWAGSLLWRDWRAD